MVYGSYQWTDLLQEGKSQKRSYRICVNLPPCCRDVLVVASGADNAQGDAVAPLVSSVAQVRIFQQVRP